MPFTEKQKALFTELLCKKGWVVRDGGIYSPSDGLWFLDGHLQDWRPQHMHILFCERAARIERVSRSRSDVPGWETVVRENMEASWAAGEVSARADLV